MVDRFHSHFCAQLVQHCEPGLVWRRTSSGGYIPIGGDKAKPHKALDFAAALLTEKNHLNETIRGHLTNAPIGISVNDKRGANDHGQTKVLAFDLDDHGDPIKRSGREFESSDPANRLLSMKMIAQDIAAALSERGIRAFTVVSGGGRGVHVWALFKNFAYSKKVSDWGKRLLEEIERDVPLVAGTKGVAHDDGKHHIEVFPKGTKHSNVALPLARSSYLYMSDGIGGFVKYDELAHEERQQAYRAIFDNLNDWPPDLDTASPVAPRASGAKSPGRKQRPVANAIDYRAAFSAFASRHDWRDHDKWISATARVAAAAKVDAEFSATAYDLWAERSSREPNWNEEAQARWHSILNSELRVSPRAFWYDAKRGGYAGPAPWGDKVRDISYPEPAPDTLNPALDIAIAMGERGYQTDDIRLEFDRRFESWDEGLLDDIWVNPAPSPLEYGEHVAPMNRVWAQIITTGTEYLHIPTGESRSEKAFRDELAHRKFIPLASDGNPRPAMKLEAAWREDPHRHRYSGLTAADPGTYRGAKFNVVRPLLIDPESGDVSVALDHIDHLTRSSGEIARETLLDFSADIVQRPGATDCQIAVVLSGGAGTGKGTYGELMRMVLGGRFMLLTSDKLTNRFNRDLFGKNLVFGDEVSFPGNRDVLEQMKSWISERQRTYEEKHLPAFTGPNVTRFVLATNNVQAIHIDPDDRRYLIIEAGAKRDADYWHRLHGWIAEPQNAKAWLHFLLTREVDRTRITGHAPMTPLKQAIVGMSNPLTAVLADLASQGVCLFDTAGEGAIASKALVDLLKARGERHAAPERVKAEIERHWPELAAGYKRSRRIRYAAKLRPVSRELTPEHGDYVQMDMPLFQQNPVCGYFLPPLPKFRELLAEKIGFVIDDHGEDWKPWEPDHGDPEHAGVDIGPKDF
jgi:Family of unknown function (DUF5906)